MTSEYTGFRWNFSPVTRVRNTPTMQNPHSEKIMRAVARKPTTNQSYNSPKTTKYVFSGMFCGSRYNLTSNKLHPVIAVDLDGTLAKLFEPYDPRRIGPPVIPMCTKVKKWLSQGKKVIILTARLNSKEHTPAQIQYTRKLISAWTKKYVGKALPSTSEKHHL